MYKSINPVIFAVPLWLLINKQLDSTIAKRVTMNELFNKHPGNSYTIDDSLCRIVTKVTSHANLSTCEIV